VWVVEVVDVLAQRGIVVFEATILDNFDIF
jgi:hypothetical protein